jgi:predicted MPP superfamily phosphohydrolase
MITRRKFIGAALLGSTALGFGLAGYDLREGGYSSRFILETVDITIAGLPPAFDGYKIGFLTDLHLGVWVPEGWIEEALDALRRAEIDLLLLGGDYILVNDNSAWQKMGIVRNERYAALSKSKAIPAIYESVLKLIAAYDFPDGSLAVCGNHDHWNLFPTFLDSIARYPKIKLLLNQESVIRRAEQSLSVFGVDDYLTGIPYAPPPGAFKDGVSKRIILSHNPDYISALLERNKDEFSLALCGHTHGGQVVLPVLGPIAAQVVDRRFIAGLHQINDRQIYTSRGLGVVGLPFRFDCPAEVTVLKLKSETPKNA